MYKKKYKKGEPIKSFNELVEQEFIYLPYGIRHRGYFMSQQAQHLYMLMQNGLLFKAEKVEVTEVEDGN